MHVWRERFSRWFTPVARRTPLSPNTITLIAVALNLVAAWCLYRRLFLTAIVFIAVGGLCDAFDGIVARVQSKTSRFGDFLDHAGDRISDSAVAAGWLLGSGVRAELTACVIILVMLNGYIGTQIEATYNQRNYENVGRGEFVLALIVFPIASSILLSNGLIAVRYGGLTIPEWLACALLAFAVLGVVQRIALAARLERSR